MNHISLSLTGRGRSCTGDVELCRTVVRRADRSQPCWPLGEPATAVHRTRSQLVAARRSPLSCNWNVAWIALSAARRMPTGYKQRQPDPADVLRVEIAIWPAARPATLAAGVGIKKRRPPGRPRCSLNHDGEHDSAEQLDFSWSKRFRIDAVLSFAAGVVFVRWLAGCVGQLPSVYSRFVEPRITSSGVYVSVYSLTKNPATPALRDRSDAEVAPQVVSCVVTPYAAAPVWGPVAGKGDVKGVCGVENECSRSGTRLTNTPEPVAA